MCVLDVPLLFEAHMDTICGVTISVVCDRSTQLERLQVRNVGMTLEEAENRIKSQMSTEERIIRSDYVLENNGTLLHLYDQINDVVKTIQPTFMRTSLEYFPPFGAVSATAVILSRMISSKFQQKKREQ